MSPGSAAPYASLGLQFGAAFLLFIAGICALFGAALTGTTHAEASLADALSEGGVRWVHQLICAVIFCLGLGVARMAAALSRACLGAAASVRDPATASRLGVFVAAGVGALFECACTVEAVGRWVWGTTGEPDPAFRGVPTETVLRHAICASACLVLLLLVRLKRPSAA